MQALKPELGDMPQVQGKSYHNDMKDPPGGFISHEILQHITSR